MVTNVMEHHGVSQEDWEQSQTPDYRVDPLNPPAWVVRHPPGQHLAMLEGAPVDEWRAEPNITVSCLGSPPRWQKAPAKPVATIVRSHTS